MNQDADFASFYAAHYRGVWAYLVRLGATHAVAADLAQDTFVRWLESRHPREGGDPGRLKYGGDASLDVPTFVGREPRLRGNDDSGARAYLYRIALNRFIDHLRSARREVAWDSTFEPATDTAPETIPRHVWSQLTLRQRQLLWLAYAEGFTHDEIATITGLASDGIRVLLSRARARFQQLQEECSDG